MLPDGTYICEDASGAWYFDPATGQTDIIAQRGGTEWYNPKYRLSYVELRLRDGTPFADWDVRGQREWVANAVERGWARPDGAPNPREEHRRERPQAKRASTGREKS